MTREIPSADLLPAFVARWLEHRRQRHAVWDRKRPDDTATIDELRDYVAHVEFEADEHLFLLERAKDRIAALERALPVPPRNKCEALWQELLEEERWGHGQSADLTTIIQRWFRSYVESMEV